MHLEPKQLKYRAHPKATCVIALACVAVCAFNGRYANAATYTSTGSAGTNATVGPISGFVMDVTENEFGHAEGRCHAVKASYSELIAEYR